MTNWKSDGMEQMEKEMIEDFLGRGRKISNDTRKTKTNKRVKDYETDNSSYKQRVTPRYDRTGNLENADELSWQSYLDAQEDDFGY